MYTGSCLCGGVRIEIGEEPGPIDVCYCRMCRKAQGGPLATNAPVSAKAFAITAGSGLVRAYASSPGEERLFCSRCGSPLISRRASAPGVVRLRVGILDEPLAARPRAQYFVASACNWWPIRDDLPQYATE